MSTWKNKRLDGFLNSFIRLRGEGTELEQMIIYMLTNQDLHVEEQEVGLSILPYHISSYPARDEGGGDGVVWCGVVWCGRG